ncbi:MAG: DUF456 domain-containing protein [Bacteroidales bacterium]
MDIVLIITGTVLMLAGLAGCILPLIPGPPVSYAGILFLHLTTSYSFSERFLIIWFIVAALVTVLDYIVPVYGTRKFGGSQEGVWGSAAGLVIGLFFAPFGLIAGPFLGAYIGEMLAQKDPQKALKAATGSFIGFITGVIIKFAVSGMLLYHFVKKLI